MTKFRGNALVTGAAKRIGAAIALDLALNGFRVAIHCNSSLAEARSLDTRIRQNGGESAVVQADLAREDEAARLLSRAADELGGPIDLLVNNASVFEEDFANTFDAELWDRHFALHLKTPVLLTQSLAAHLPADRQGLVVNVIDQRVWRLTPRYFSYTLSKSALWTATQTMAQALAPNVRVNALGPGPTVANSRQQPSDFAAQQAGLLLGAGPGLDEFGRSIRYLWETPSVTGQMIAIDGGQHLAWQTPDVTGMAE